MYAQGELGVNLYTGTAQVEVALGVVTDHDLEQPIILSYDAKGMRLDEPMGNYGIGWSMESGGSVKREVRKLPDDYTGTGIDSRRGWLYKNSANVAVNADVAALPNTANLTPDCPDELSDFNKLSGFGYVTDSEPDLYTYNANGLSGSFVFDNNDPPSIRLIPYADIKIEPAFASATDKTIVSFRITTNRGVIMHFTLAAFETKLTRKVAGVTTVDFLKTDFELYDSARFLTGGITFKSEWMLTKVESHTGAVLEYGYSTKSYDNRDTVRVGIRNNVTPATYTRKDIYSTRRKGTTLLPTFVKASSGPRIDFAYSADGLLLLSNVKATDTRRPTNDQFVKEFNLTYFNLPYSPTYFRKFLASITETSGCDQLPPYKFSYAGCGADGTYTRLPPPSSKSKDIWGYYNGKLNSTLFPKLYVYPDLPVSERYRIYPIPNYAGYWFAIDGADRTADDKAIINGSLIFIQHQGGGSTTIEYEPNDFYDAVAGQSFYGGGVRVKKVTYFDGVNPSANIVKTYEYKDASGNSSGRILVKPTFAIPTYEYRNPQNPSQILPYSLLSESDDLAYDYLTVRTEHDIAPALFTHGSRVGYKYVKVSRPGAGFAKFEYLMPGTFGDGPTGDWSPSQNKFARSSACPTMGIISGGGAWCTPYSADPNYDYERGMILKKSEYDEQSQLVREIANLYTPIYKSGTIATKVYGVHYENYPYGSNTFLFSKYFLLTDVLKVISSETVTTYDASSTTINNSTTAEYFYEGTAHKLLTRSKHRLADGTIIMKRMKYPLDYGTIPSGSDKASTMIARLQSDVFNTVEISRNGDPIEVITTQTKPGETEKVIFGAVVKFNDFDKGKPLAEHEYAFNATTPVDYSPTFVKSYVNATTKIFTIDPNYELVGSVSSYWNFDKPQSSVGQDKAVRTTLWGFNSTIPVVSAKNVSSGQFAFSDFETSTGSEFTQDGTSVGTGRWRGSGLLAWVKLSKQLTKANNKYILSFWFKKIASESQSFTITTKSVTGANVITQTFTLNPGSSDYEYVEKIVSVDPALSTFVVEIKGDDPGDGSQGYPQSSPSLLPLIDDVAFYPVDANLASRTFTIPFGVNSSTSRDRTGFVEFDKLGRTKYTFDRFKNITGKNMFSFPSDLPRTLVAAISTPVPADIGSASIYDGPHTFSAQENCIDGITYEWDFGNGYIVGQKDQVHTFTTPGLKYVSLRVTHPVYGTSSVTETYNVTIKDCTVSTCAKGVKEYSTCTSTTVSTYTCANIATAPQTLGTVFRVLGIDVNETITAYQWKIRNTGTSTWANAATTQEYSGMKITPGATPSYEVMCEITTNTGRKGYSMITYVTVTNCD